MAPGICASTRPNVEDRTGEPKEAASHIDIQFSKSISGRLTIDFSKISAAVTDPASRCRDQDRASKVGIRRNDICEMCRRGRYGAMHRLFVFNDIWDHPLAEEWRARKRWKARLGVLRTVHRFGAFSSPGIRRR